MRPAYIYRLILLLILAGTTMAHAMAQTDTVYAGQSSVLNVVEVPGDTYTWELYSNVTGVDFVAVPGNCPPTAAYFTGGINAGPAVNVTWLLPGTYFFKVTAVRPGCTNNLKVGKIVILEALPTATLDPPPPICPGETSTLTVQLTGTAPWSIDVTDGTITTTYANITASPFTIPVSPAVSTSYTVTRVSDIHGLNLIHSNTVNLIVKPRLVTSPIIQYGLK